MKPDTVNTLLKVKSDLDKNILILDEKIKYNLKKIKSLDFGENNESDDLKALILTWMELSETVSLMNRVIKVEEINYKEKLRRAEQLIILELYKKDIKNRKKTAFNSAKE